ncbi:hypothetical protein O3X23_20530 [Streptomyces sp. H39-S7]|nr:hypothetical protein [Streptomyces sp. H39-S7]MCZ4121744.1 hypothetical protein [Streptomyces sp. H39-S7]
MVHRRRRRPAARGDSREIRDADIARLSPLKHRTLILGRYSFTASTGRGLRPLRDPDAVALDDEEE